MKSTLDKLKRFMRAILQRKMIEARISILEYESIAAV